MGVLYSAHSRYSLCPHTVFSLCICQSGVSASCRKLSPSLWSCIILIRPMKILSLNRVYWSWCCGPVHHGIPYDSQFQSGYSVSDPAPCLWPGKTAEDGPSLSLLHSWETQTDVHALDVRLFNSKSLSPFGEWARRWRMSLSHEHFCMFKARV